MTKWPPCVGSQMPVLHFSWMVWEKTIRRLHTIAIEHVLQLRAAL